jgi:hypothetical protein
MRGKRQAKGPALEASGQAAMDRRKAPAYASTTRRSPLDA